MKAALTADGVEWDADEVNSIMGIPKPVAIRQLLREEATDDRVERIHADFQRRMKDFYRTDPSVAAVEGAEETFRQLRSAGVKVALDTGFDRTIVNVLMERLGWGPELLDTTVTSDEVAHGRPAADLVFEAMSRVGVSDVTSVAKVGDTPSDLGEGTAAGCGWVIGVTEGTHTHAQLEPHPHTHLVPNVTHVPSLVLA